MGKQSTTYTINFKAQYDSLGKLEEELNKIKKQSGKLNLTEKEQEKVQELILKIKQLKDLTSSKMSDGHLLNVEDFKMLEKSFNKLITQANNFSSALIKMLPADLQNKINELKKQINELNKANQTLGSQKGFSTKRFNKEANAIAMRNIQEAGPSANISDHNGNLISTYADLKQRAEELTNETRELNQEEKQLLQIWQQVEQEVKPVMDAWQTEWDQITEKIEENRKKVLELLETTKQLASIDQKDAPMELDPTSANAYGSFSDAVSDLTENISESTSAMQKHEQQSAKGIKTQGAHKKQTDQVTKSYDKNRTTLGKAVHNVVSYGTALTLIRSIYTKLIQTITEMDKALTGMTVVTQLSREQAWNLTGTLQDLAKQTGMTSTEIANMTTMYLQQGKTLADALELTEAAAKAARIAGISGSESINLLTNAMNGFQLKASQAMEVSDKFAALAASAATDYEELATALSKVAAQANLAGMSMDFTLGLLTKGIEVTREAPETIGTALKTVISRMRELTDYGETLEDGIDVNRVDTALKNIGVSLLDANREFRDLEEVLTEVGSKWNTLNKNQQANVAVALAGTRQQSRLIAMMQDFDRTQELVNISMNSAGATAAQHRKYMEGLEAATTKLTTSYQQLITSFMNSDIIIAIINGLGSGLEFVANNIELVGIAIGGLASAYAILNKEKILDKATTIIVTALTAAHKKSIDQLVKAKMLELTTTKLAEGATAEETEQVQKAIIAKKLEEQGIKGVIKTKFAAQIASELLAAGYTAETAAIKAAELATQKLNDTMKKNWILLIVAVVLALAAAWYSAAKETSAGMELMNSFKDLLKSLWEAFKPVVDIITELLKILVTLFGFINDMGIMPTLKFVVVTLQTACVAIKFIAHFITETIDVIKDWVSAWETGGAVLEWIVGIIKVLMGLGLGGPIGLVAGLFDAIQVKGKSLLDWAGHGLKKAMNWISDWQWSTEDQAERTTEKIADLQNEIYDNQQKSNTLKPLIEEYDSLGKKAIKTAEDLKRMKEIEDELGAMDESYLNKNGTVNIKVVKQAEEDAYKAAQEGINDAYEMATGKDGISTGHISDEMRSAVSDYWANQAVIASEQGKLSSDVANAVASNFKQTVESMSDAELQALDKQENGYSQLYNSVADLEQEMNILAKNEDSTLFDHMEVYENALANVPEEAKKAFNSIYSLYGEYASMIDALNLQGDKKAKFLNKLQVLGIDQTEFDNIKNAYLAQNPNNTEEDFNKWFRETINNSKGDKNSLVKNLMKGQGLVLQNAIEDATVLSNQQILEDYTKAISSIDNISELSKKAGAGTITMDEIRQLEASNPEIFKNKDLLDKFWKGEYNSTEEKKKAAEIAQNELESRLAIAKLQNDTAQINSLEKQLDNLKYAELYSMQIWKNSLETTKQEAKQIRLQSELNKLAEKYEATTDPNKRKDLLKKQMEFYKQLAINAESIFSTGQKELYNFAVGEGYIVDGKVVTTSEELLQLGASSDMIKFLEIESENIQNYHDYTEEYLDGYRYIIEEEYNRQKEILNERKDQYEKYFDSMDALEEEQERAQSRESIISQLSALAGGSDAASNSLRKDLLSQLQDLNKEEADARKQAIRDAALNDIDENIDSIDKKIGVLTGLTKEELEIQAAGLGYDSGGLVNYTGRAWVHGTRSKPEAFLSANDTQLIQSLVSSLNYGTLQGVLTVDENTSQIVVENINISTSQLNNNQDFRTAGQIFAEEFDKAIKQRGINRNVKK